MSRRPARPGFVRRRIGVVGALLVAALALAAGAVVLALSGSDEEGDAPATGGPLPPDLRGLQFPAPRQRAGFSDQGFVNYRLGGEYDLDVSPAMEVEWARAAGATVHRVGFEWRQAEPRPGQVEQGYIDRVRAFTDRFERAGGRVVVFLAFAPEWASDVRGCAGCLLPPADTGPGLSGWRRFVRLAAATFPRALAFEIWNEPNLAGFWSPAPAPDRYARIANAALEELRAAAPRARVLVGSVAGFPEDGAGHMSSAGFLRAAGQAGLRRDFDAVSWHVYPGQDGRHVRLEGVDADGELIGAIRGAAEALLDRPRHWVTEAGVTRTGRDWGVSADAQAVGLLRLYQRLAAIDGMEGVLIHQLFEVPALPAESADRGYAIVTRGSDGRYRATPAWCALRRVAADPGPAPRGSGCAG